MQFFSQEDAICYRKIFLNALSILITAAEEQKPIKNETIIDVDCEVKNPNPLLIERNENEKV